MEETPIIYKHEQTHFSYEEFIKRFNNFYLIFMIGEPWYRENIKKVLQDEKNDPVLYKSFQKMREEFEKTKLNNVNLQNVVEKNKKELFDIYKTLREKGFSNKELGLTYW